jgi:ribosomal protein S18 acetylase RimI-like enzyme
MTPSTKAIAAPIEVRDLRASDRAPLEAILRATNVFQEHEIAIALELIDAPSTAGYRFFVAEVGGMVAGYACFGETPCTQGTWDLYWIAVDPVRHGRGIGQLLMRATEDAIRARNGRLVIIETASKPIYEPTRAFYLRYGCKEVARVPDFYAPGDDKIIYARNLS